MSLFARMGFGVPYCTTDQPMNPIKDGKCHGKLGPLVVFKVYYTPGAKPHGESQTRVEPVD